MTSTERTLLLNRIDQLEADVARLRAELDGIRISVAADDHAICQALGRALGYPRYAADPANFPDAAEADGVCTGEHVAGSLAAEAAREIDRLRGALAAETARLDWLAANAPGAVRDVGLDAERPRFVVMGAAAHGRGPSVRAAIDNAMGAGEGGAT